MTTAVLTDRWVKTDADRAAVGRGCYFDEDAAQHVVDFFEKFLRHSKGQWAGKPFELLEWQKADLLMPLFGWKRADGTRRYRIGYIEVPKKNGKSTLLAGIGLYLLVADKQNADESRGEPGAEVYGAAADREQAGIVYREAANMARSSPALSSRLEVTDSRKNIAHLASASFYRVLSADAFRAEGLNIHGLLFDELHAQRDRRLWDALRYGGASRRQPLLLSITTAGFDRNSICWEQRDYAKKVLDGVIEDDSFFAFIRCADDDDDWRKEETWHKANPSLGVTIPVDEMASACKEAQESATKENSFKRYRLNLWTEQDIRWLAMDKWDSCGVKPEESLAWRARMLEEMRGRECFAGLDLATTTDIAAQVLIFPGPEGYTVLPFFWIPSENAQKRERKDRVPYMTWAKQGFIEMTEGNVIDYEVIRRRSNELHKTYDLKEIGYDRWNATQIVTQLLGDGLNLVEFGQGFASMTAPTKELEKLVLEGKIKHGGNPVLRWMASNVTVETDAAGNLKPSKKKSTEKIDGIVAAVMALGRALVAEPEAATYFRASAQI